MNDITAAFKITSERNCPLYAAEDIFILSAQSVHLPLGHASCLILVRELTNLLFNTIVPAQDNGFEDVKDQTFNCGGCTGLIKFQIEEDLKKAEEEIASFPDDEDTGGAGDGAKSHLDKQDVMVISGQLSEIPPSELMQFFHMHHKTGRLVMDVDNGTARVAFREGEVIDAKFLDFEDKDAFFAMLRETHGRFSFVKDIPDTLHEVDNIGDFMMILMEGIRRLDEEEG